MHFVGSIRLQGNGINIKKKKKQKKALLFF